MEIKNLLPIGSVVLLKDAKKELMIIGVKQLSEKHDAIKDYIGVMYPEGYMNRDIFFIFDHDNISEVLYEGYRSKEQKEFLEQLEKVLENTE